MKLTLKQAERMMCENNDNLDLRGTSITSLPEGLNVRGWLDLEGTLITSLPKSLTVSGALYLKGTPITNLPEGLTVGALDLRNTSITNLPDNLNVGDWLDLEGTSITRLPKSLTVGGALYLKGTPITSLPEGLMVGALDLEGTSIVSLPDSLIVCDWLDLRDTLITSLPKSLIVGGALDLRGTSIVSLPENLIVGGALDLNDTPITNLPEDLIVGGWLDLRDTSITNLPKNLMVGGEIFVDNVNSLMYKQLKNGDYVPSKYLYADDSLIHVKSCHKVKGYTMYVGKIKGKNVISDGKNYVHCRTFKNGIEELLYRESEIRGVEQYQNLTKESRVTLNEAIIMYRVITGVCKQGTENFVLSQKDLKKDYTVSEIINITRNQLGSIKFAKFFDS